MEDAQRCSVCLTAPPAEPATVKECGHEYCLECLRQWCRTRRQPRCPLCQASIQRLVLRDGTEQDAPPPDRVEEEGPDLGCLDHAYFAAESDRLLCRARAAQTQLFQAAYGSGRRGGAAASEATDALQQVVEALAGMRQDMRSEVPFRAEDVLHSLYSLEQLVQQIAAGGWSAAAGAPQLGPARTAERFSAADATAGLHEWQQHSDEDCDPSDEEELGLDGKTRQRLARASLGGTPGRRPTPGRRGSSGSLAGGGARRGSSGSLAGGGGGGVRRR